MERIYAIILIFIISTVSIVYVYNKPFTIHHSFFERPMEESQVIDKTWVNFLDSCSGEKIIEKPVEYIYLPVSSDVIRHMSVWLTDQDQKPLNLREENLTIKFHLRSC